MTRARATLVVAWWEFRRFFRLRDQILSIVLAVVMAGAGYGVVRWMRAEPTRPRLAIGPEVPASWQEAIPPEIELVEPRRAHRDALLAREVDGVLAATDQGPVLLVRRTAAWHATVRDALQASLQAERLRAQGVSLDRLHEWLAPVPFKVELVTGDGEQSRAETIAAIVVGSLMMIGIWTGLAFMFVGITGEKQLRVTEQVVSAISPQAWIDGKILGLSAVAVAATLGYVASALVLAFASRWAGVEWAWPAALVRPGTLAVFVLLGLLGFAFWNTFIGAVAATISDPHTSNRGGLILLPVLPVVFAVMAVADPSSVAIRVLSLLPPTAPLVMLVRLVLDDPAVWEVALALVLLAAATWVMRVAAGRVFKLAMLTYGQDPSWGQLWRWVREPD